MIVHELKTWPEAFQAVWDGKKRHEIRVNDRDFAVGDILHLREWDPEAETYMARSLVVEVTFMTHGGQWGIPDSLCVMSISANLSEEVRQAAVEAICAAIECGDTSGVPLKEPA